MKTYDTYTTCLFDCLQVHINRITVKAELQPPIQTQLKPVMIYKKNAEYIFTKN